MDVKVFGGRQSDQGEMALTALESRLVAAAIFLFGLIFLVWGGSNQELNAEEARLGIAIAEPFVPYGQIFGRLDPSVWVGQVAIGKLFHGFQSSWPTQGVVRWPAVVAGLLIGLLICRRVARFFGLPAGLGLALVWCSGLALIDRTGGFSVSLFSGLRTRWVLEGPDLLVGLAVIGALDRLIHRGADWIAGLWLGAAFLLGGLPGPVLVLLAAIVIGRRDTQWNLRLALPLVLIVAAWSAWALWVEDSVAWWSAVMMPLTQPFSELSQDWQSKPKMLQMLGIAEKLIREVLILSLPWSPLALFALSRRIRAPWMNDQARTFFLGWVQIGAASLIMGCAIPGLADVAKAPILLSLAVIAALVAHRLATIDWQEDESLKPLRPLVLGFIAVMVVAWLVPMVSWEFYLSLAIPYYRPVMIVLTLISLVIFMCLCKSLWRKSVGFGLSALVLMALAAKITHWGYYSPEWNYRLGQGPWGRAIGQWIPEKWPIYTFGSGSNTWSASLAFATERPFRQLEFPRNLNSINKNNPVQPPKFVLLHPEEFSHWPEGAPKLIEVFRFHDQLGLGVDRVLARTEGDPGWKAAAAAARSGDK